MGENQPNQLPLFPFWLYSSSNPTHLFSLFSRSKRIKIQTHLGSVTTSRSGTKSKTLQEYYPFRTIFCGKHLWATTVTGTYQLRYAKVHLLHCFIVSTREWRRFFFIQVSALHFMHFITCFSQKNASPNQKYTCFHVFYFFLQQVNLYISFN